MNGGLGHRRYRLSHEGIPVRSASVDISASTHVLRDSITMLKPLSLLSQDSSCRVMGVRVIVPSL